MLFIRAGRPRSHFLKAPALSITVPKSMTVQILSFLLGFGIFESPISVVIVTDTIPLGAYARDCEKLHVVSVAGLLGEAIRRITNEESVSSLFV